jgi:hypothetical protein
VQVLGSAPWAERNLGCAAQSPLIAVAVGNAVLFWLFSAALFDDAFRWRSWHAAAWLLAALLGAVQCPVVVGLDESDALRRAARLSLRVLPVLCVAGALWAALRHWRADLVESRRRLRIWPCWPAGPCRCCGWPRACCRWWARRPWRRPLR